MRIDCGAKGVFFFGAERKVFKTVQTDNNRGVYGMVLVAVNKDYGGFSISKEVVDIMKSKGVPVDFSEQDEKDNKFFPVEEYGYHVYNENFGIESEDYNACRTFPPLIEAIREAKNPNGKMSDIAIIEIPDDVDWYIDEFDGYEIIREKHRTW
jgi:hypothetical protein